jgi:hypothetical protein
MIRIEEFILSSKGYPGRPIEDRAAIARAELITGQTVDSNATWLSQELVQMGFIIKRHFVNILLTHTIAPVQTNLAHFLRYRY